MLLGTLPFISLTAGLKGNPLAPEILNVYSEPNGTSKLLAYLLDNLVGELFCFHILKYTSQELSSYGLLQPETFQRHNKVAKHSL